MKSPEQPQDSGSTSKPGSDQDRGTLSLQASRPVLSELGARRASEQAREHAKRIKRARHKAQTDFNAWKKTLCSLINKESRIEFNEEALTWQFVVPARLNRFFYEVMIKEYVRAKKATNEGDAAVMVRQEFDDAADAVIKTEQMLLEQRRARARAESEVKRDDLAVSKEALDHEPDRAGDPVDSGSIDRLGGDNT
jgi:hypothetical protein